MAEDNNITIVCDRLDKLIVKIDVGLQEYIRNVMSLDLTAAISNRVIEKGTDNKGAKFLNFKTGKPYSKGYEKYREKKNKPTDRKTFQFGGEMWDGFGRTDFKKEGDGKYELELGGTTTDSADKIKSNSEYQKKNILLPTKEEVSDITEAIHNEIDELLRNAGYL